MVRLSRKCAGVKGIKQFPIIGISGRIIVPLLVSGEGVVWHHWCQGKEHCRNGVSGSNSSPLLESVIRIVPYC